MLKSEFLGNKIRIFLNSEVAISFTIQDFIRYQSLYYAQFMPFCILVSVFTSIIPRLFIRSSTDENSSQNIK